MTRRSDKQQIAAYFVPHGQQGSVWAATDFCDSECQAEGASVVALFSSEQTCRQFCEQRDLHPTRMPVYASTKPHH